MGSEMCIRDRIGADLICEVAHHAKKDRHELGEPCPIKQRWHEAFDTLRAAIEQAEKPVECMCGVCKLGKREWVGLTDEEIKEIIGPWGPTPIKGYTRKLFDQIEAKLKEKNR